MPDGKILVYNGTPWIWRSSRIQNIITNENYWTLANKITDIENKVSKIVSGSFTGNSDDMRSSAQNINIGFKPSYVWVCGVNYFILNGNEPYFSSSVNNINGVALGFTDTGFYVNNRMINGNSIWLNFLNVTYSYICV